MAYRRIATRDPQVLLYRESPTMLVRLFAACCFCLAALVLVQFLQHRTPNTDFWQTVGERSILELIWKGGVFMAVIGLLMLFRCSSIRFDLRKGTLANTLSFFGLPFTRSEKKLSGFDKVMLIRETYTLDPSKTHDYRVWLHGPKGVQYRVCEIKSEIEARSFAQEVASWLGFEFVDCTAVSSNVNSPLE